MSNKRCTRPRKSARHCSPTFVAGELGVRRLYGVTRKSVKEKKRKYVKMLWEVQNMSEVIQVKEEARKLVETLPENATWEDLTCLVMERQRVEEGIADLESGNKWTSDEIRNKLGIGK